MPQLVIVESPGKIKKIGAILGPGYVIKASLGHVRDLPRNSGRRTGSGPRPSGPDTASIGLTLDGTWRPEWSLLDGKRDNVAQLKRLGASGTVWLATDLDREGEAIAWHLLEILGGDPGRFRRVTFAEITEAAIKRAFSDPRTVDMDLVRAYLARRFLDRLVGYTVSPLLSGKLYAGVSAGRVQSAALGILADRDEKIRIFQAQAYYGVDLPIPVADAAPEAPQPVAQLVDAKGAAARFETRAAADGEVALTATGPLRVKSVEETPQVQNPKPPFTTSTLQQAASSRFKMKVADTMSTAQKLYEAGAITYMRSDAVFLAPESVAAARATLENIFGPSVLPDTAPSYKGRAGAQEAHEAIRPTDPARSQEDYKLEGDQAKLYALIRARLLASQMKPAVFRRTDWTIEGGPYPNGAAARRFAVRGRVVVDPGWHRVLPPPRGSDEPPVLPAVTEGAYPAWGAGELAAEVAESWTQAPKRYTEAALVAELENKGVGRPSTYAATLAKIQDRGYVFIDAKRVFVVTPFGRVVDACVKRGFPKVRDVTYTSALETQLDEIAAGSERYTVLLDGFWAQLSAELEHAQSDTGLTAPSRPVIQGAQCPKCSGQVWAWIRKGVFLAACRSKACAVEQPFEWTPKRPSRKTRKGESAEKREAEEAAAEQRGAGRCPLCKGAIQRWRAPKFGTLEACGAWPACSHLAFAAEKAKKTAAGQRTGAPKRRAATPRRSTTGSR